MCEMALRSETKAVAEAVEASLAETKEAQRRVALGRLREARRRWAETKRGTKAVAGAREASLAETGEARRRAAQEAQWRREEIKRGTKALRRRGVKLRKARKIWRNCVETAVGGRTAGWVDGEYVELEGEGDE